MSAEYVTSRGSVPGSPMANFHVVRRFVRRVNRYPVIPTLIMTVMVIAAVFAPYLAPKDPLSGSLHDREIPPMWLEGGRSEFILGTDPIGRDVLSRIIYGARISLVISGTVIAVGGTVGTALGIGAGWYGGNVDEIIMRIVDFTLAVPFILVALVTVIVFGQSFAIVVILLAVFSWNGFARQVRAEALSIKTTDYVAIAKIAGASGARIMIRHIFPGVINTLMVVASLRVGSLILTEAILSFLGAGIPKPTPAWGVMVADGRDYLGTSWWIAFFPGLAIFLLVLASNFLGDWLRDKLDPRLRQLA